jgi:hypothetical protein
MWYNIFIGKPEKECVGFEVITAMRLAPCSPTEVCRRFGATCFCFQRRPLSQGDRIYYVKFEVFTAVTVKNAVFWDMALCRYCVKKRFGGTYRLHPQGRKIRCSHLLTLVSRSVFFHPSRGRRYDPPKRWFTQ